MNIYYYLLPSMSALENKHQAPEMHQTGENEINKALQGEGDSK